ncbi:carboxypeptidase-like regulatory domain-containing protein [Chitinophaga pinensis]|uniref:carboxypeptidase-like regulatory domain-containing protein n=1 Tax=Chitinophaga pinensis TaxID=79329 RepID=UPI0021BD9517|nr:carboxypeptidase-like regulatory domain-containing protein [Chitinophaga pinensis]
MTGKDGKGLSGVSVTVRNESTGFQSVSITNKEGKYSFIQLPLGKPYTVKAAFVGFATQIKTS